MSLRRKPRWCLPAPPKGSGLVLAIDAAGAFGFGASFPFISVYLTVTRGFGLSAAGVVAGVFVVAALAGGPLGGIVADRAGPRASMCSGLALAVAGTGLLVSATWQAVTVLGAAVSGFGAAMAGPAVDTALAKAVAAEDRSTAFSIKHVSHNIGMGLGSIVGALVIDPDDAASYALPFAIDLGAVAVGLALGLLLPRIEAEGGARRGRGGYAAAARDPRLRRLLGLTLGVFAAGFGAYSLAVPAHMAVGIGLDTRLLGLWFTVNTVVVIGTQMISLRLVRGRRRTRALAVLSVVWAAAWGLVLLTGAVGAAGATILVMTSAAVFGIGETLFAPTLPVLVNAIAPDDAVGRYNGAFSFTMTVGNALAMVASGAMLDADLAVPLFGCCLLVCLLCARTARGMRVPADVDVVP